MSERKRVMRKFFRCLTILCALNGLPSAAADELSNSAAKADGSLDRDIQTAIDEGRFVDADRLLGDSAQSGGGGPKLMLLAGKLALAKGNAETALKYLDAASALSNESSEILESRGIALSMLQRYDEAINALKSAVQQDRKAWRAWNALGIEYDRRRNWDLAEEAYTNALSGSGGAAIVWNNRGYSRLCRNKPEEAAADFVEALNKKPDFAAARNNLRLALAAQGQYDRALAGAKGSTRAELLNNVGYVALLRGDYAKAKALFTEAIGARDKYYAKAVANLELAKSLEEKHSNSK
jgi:Flp pilus assembly protein TadD